MTIRRTVSAVSLQPRRWSARLTTSDPIPYGGLLAVLLAVTVAADAVEAGLGILASLPPWVIDPRWLGAAVYGTATAGVLVAGWVLVHRTRGRAPTMAIEERLNAALLMWGLATVGWFVVFDAVALPTVPQGILAPLAGIAGVYGLAAGVYARVTDTAIRFRVPTPTRQVGAAVAAAALAGAAFALLGRAVFDVPRGSSPTPLAIVLESVVVVPILVGVGYGLLFNGAIQASLRERVGPAGAVAAVVSLAGVYPLAAADFGGQVHWLATVAVAAVLPLAAAVLAVAALEFLGMDRRAAGSGAILHATAGGAIVGWTFLAAYWLAASLTLVGLDVGAAASAAFLTSPAVLIATAAASYGYERARSVWVPVVAFAAFFAAPAVLTYLVP